MEKDNCCVLTQSEKDEIKNLEKNLDTIATCGGVVHYQKSHIIFYEGHIPYGFYILKRGEVQLSRTTMAGNKVALPDNSKNIFGLFHLITNTPYCATAQAKSDAEMIFVPKSVVLEFLHHH